MPAPFLVNTGGATSVRWASDHTGPTATVSIGSVPFSTIQQDDMLVLFGGCVSGEPIGTVTSSACGKWKSLKGTITGNGGSLTNNTTMSVWTGRVKAGHTTDSVTIDFGTTHRNSGYAFACVRGVAINAKNVMTQPTVTLLHVYPARTVYDDKGFAHVIGGVDPLLYSIKPAIESLLYMRAGPAVNPIAGDTPPILVGTTHVDPTGWDRGGFLMNVGGPGWGYGFMGMFAAVSNAATTPPIAAIDDASNIGTDAIQCLLKFTANPPVVVPARPPLQDTVIRPRWIG